GFESAGLLVARDVTKLGELLEFGKYSRRPGIELVGVWIFQAILKLRSAYTVFDGQVLNGLHKQSDAVDLCQRRLEPPDYIAGTGISLFEGFQVYLNAAAVDRHIGAVHADE